MTQNQGHSMLIPLTNHKVPDKVDAKLETVRFTSAIILLRNSNPGLRNVTKLSSL